MRSLAALLIVIISVSPALYIIGEIKAKRSLRMLSFIILVPTAVITGWIVGMMAKFNYNAWYGSSTKQLIDEINIQLKIGNQEQVRAVLTELSDMYHPTYENRAHYNELADKAVQKLRDADDSTQHGDAPEPASPAR